MYTITTTPGGHIDAADSIPAALAALAAQLARQLPTGPVAWCITDPRGIEHRHDSLNSRLDLLAIAVDQLVEELCPQLHRSVDGEPRAARTV